MDWSSIITVALGVIIVGFTVYVYWKDPFKWTPRRTSGSIPRPEKSCSSLDDFVAGHKKIIFAGETLGEITNNKYALLPKLAADTEKETEFFLANPALGKDSALFQVIAHRVGGKTDSEQLYKSLEESVSRLEELSNNHSNVIVKVVDYVIGPSFVLVDPGTKQGKVRITLNRFYESGENRMTFAEVTPGDATGGALYKDMCKLYNNLKKYSTPLHSQQLVPAKAA